MQKIIEKKNENILFQETSVYVCVCANKCVQNWNKAKMSFHFPEIEAKKTNPFDINRHLCLKWKGFFENRNKNNSNKLKKNSLMPMPMVGEMPC